MIKGIAIFMVVMGHVLTMCIRDIDRAAAFKLIGQLHMPLFFFISGWFSCKLLTSGCFERPSLTKRAAQLLLPMVAVSTLWIYYYPHSALQSPLTSTWAGLWGDAAKNGYWFTFVLFQIIAIYTCMVPLLGRVGNAGRIAVCCAVCIAVDAIVYFLPPAVAAAGSFTFTAWFLPAFLIGVLARTHSERFVALCSDRRFYTVALVVAAVLLYYVCWYWEFPVDFAIAVYAVYPLQHVSLAVVAIAVVRPWSERAFAADADAPTRRIASIWAYLGERSLAIYLLHYFFLFPMGWLQGPLLGSGLGMAPCLAVAAIAAALIIALTLMADALIRRSRILSLLLTGTR